MAIPSVAAHAPDWAFDVENFKYYLKTDSFTCPANQILTTNGNWYSKKNGKSLTQMKHYKTSACLSCELFAKCTKNARGRLIERSEHADLIYDNKIRIENNYEICRRLQAIVQHPYGVIKEQWDFYYIMTKKSIKHASVDVELIFTAYNLKRIFNLIDINMLKKYLKSTGLFYWHHTVNFKAFYQLLKFVKNAYRFFKTAIYYSGNRLYLLQN